MTMSMVYGGLNGIRDGQFLTAEIFENKQYQEVIESNQILINSQFLIGYCLNLQ